MDKHRERTLLSVGSLILLTLSVGCVEGGERGSTDEGAGGGTAGGGGTEDTVGVAGASNGGSSSGGTTTRTIGTLDPPPAPETSDVPQPSETVDAPNLKVLPWAGFKAAVSYTFDDTQPSQLEHWDELKATGVPFTFFCNPSGKSRSGFVEGWTAVAASGSEIGNHTWSHCYSSLSGCTPVGTAEEEIDEATDWIVSNLGVPALYSFASPYGDAGWNSYASSRFLVGRGVTSGMVAASGTTDWYNLPIFPVTAGQTAEDFDASIDKAVTQGKWDIFMFHSILPTSNNWYAGVEIAGITASIEYALGLKTVWFDTMGDVGAYARAQQMFEALTLTDNTWTWSLPDHFPYGKVLRVTVDGGTLSQNGEVLAWDSHGYYEVALDVGSLTWSP